MERGNAITINVQTPLLQTNLTHQQIHNQNHNEQPGEEKQLKINVVDGGDGEEDETLLDKTLQRLEFHLRFLGFYQRSALSIVLSWIGFLVVGVVVPVLFLQLTHCSGCEDYQVNEFEYEILASQVLLGAVSLICVSHNIRKRGIRKFLFVDKYRGHTSRFMDQYIKKVKVSYQLLLLSLLPCCILKFGHEALRMENIQSQSWWQAGLIVSALTISWTYLSAISLVACILFHLSCSLQLIHFNDYMNFFAREPDSKETLEKEPDVSFLMTEHIRLRHNLSKISHRFRIYLLLVFLFVTASLFATLMQITGAFGRVTFLNGGNFAVTSVVQVFETLLCLHAGTKISSKAQSIGATATKCHALATCNEGTRRSNSADSVNQSISVASLPSHQSESDLESLDSLSIPTRMQIASISTYNQRQSFLTYLQANPGGITLYGWTVDRSLLTTIFFTELSLVLFVLGQTIIFSSETPQ